MVSNEQIKRHTSLQFKEAADAFVKPLLLGYGFVQTDDENEFSRFDSAGVMVTLRHEPYSYELNLTVTKHDCPERSFSLQDIVEAAGGEESTFFQASSSDRMFQCVASITELLKKYGSSVLKGDAKAFAHMTEVSDHRSQAYTKDVVQRPVREAAELAWKQKHYREVRRLYETISEDLTPIERKRLVYAIERQMESP